MAYTISNEPLTYDQFDFIQEQLDLHAGEAAVRSISEMDGYFVAVLSYVDVIHFNDWYAGFWGGAQCLPKWKNEQVYQRFFDLLVQHMNQISVSLAEDPEGYFPIFNMTEEGDVLDCREWCQGYLRGTALGSGWGDLTEEPASGILALVRAPLDAEQDLSQLKDDYPDLLRIAAKLAYNYWLALRQKDDELLLELARAEPKVGRNDPCPCGSGKKFKQCCQR
jgi:uncharacterized protein